jgi:hypothetical protein
MYTLVLQKSVGILTPRKFHVSFLSGIRQFEHYRIQKVYVTKKKVLHPTVGFPTPVVHKYYKLSYELLPLFPIFRET